MSTTEGGSRIVTDGLILYYDAANPKSYVSGDTISNDLSVTQSNGTLTNGVLYDTDSKGSWVFDGLDDKIIDSNGESFNFGVNDSFSIDVWFKPITTSNNGLLVSKWKPNDAITTARGYYLGLILLGSPSRLKVRFAFFNTNVHFIAVNIDENILVNNWYNCVLTYDGTSNSSGVKLYLNSLLRDKTVTRDNLISPATTEVDFQFGGQGNLFSGFLGFNGYIPNVKVYDRVLTNEDVENNYKALKNRFNL